ncbi:MAG: porin family protein [Proteiniphilum sp.]|nr:porin family protein [Proteiniphilum sp.]
MKKMRLTAVVGMLVIVTAVSAQVSLGVKGGVNMSNFWGEELNSKNAKFGFNIGLAAEYEFAPAMAIQSGLFFTTKGTKIDYDFPIIGKVDGTINSMNLQIPVHFAYKTDITPGTRIVFHGGPYVAYGVGGKISSGGTDLADTFGDDGLLKPFDAGLGLGVGAEFGPFLVDLGWDMGLVNIANYSNGDLKNQNAYLSVGYKF